MPDLAETFGWRGADLRGGAVGRLQFRELRLELIQAATQRIVFSIRNLGRVLAVIEFVMVSDLRAQTSQLVAGGSLIGHFIPGWHGLVSSHEKSSR